MGLELWKIVVLSVVQGATEFLPISSSGHIVVIAAWLSPNGIEGIDIGEVNIVLHLGTLGSIVVFYFQRILRLLSEDRRVVLLLVVATIPAIAIGLPLKKMLPDEVEQAVLENPLLAGCLLPVTGIILLIGARAMKGKDRYQDLTMTRALLLGLAQAFAILPGISRSGTTITTGMTLGLEPKSAATFSFLMAIPVIGGGGLLEIVSLLKEDTASIGAGTPLWHLAIGAAVAFVVGYASLVWLVRWLERGRFSLFAWWCIPFGIAVIVWQLSK